MMRTLTIEDVTTLLRKPRPLDDFEWRFVARVTRPTFIENPDVTIAEAALTVGVISSLADGARTTLRVNGKAVTNPSQSRDHNVAALNQPMPWTDDWASMWTGKKLTNAKVLFTDTETWNTLQESKN